METALGWIGAVMDAIGSIIPRILHLECVDVGASIKRGSRVKALKPGLHVYWPLWTVIYRRASNRQTKKLGTQILTTGGGSTVAAGAMVRYRLDDAVKSLIETDDVDGSIDDEALAVLCEYVTQATPEEIQSDRQKTNTRLTYALRSVLRDYGVYVERMQLTDFAIGRVLIHAGYLPTAHLKEEETVE